jgi:tyrosyl-tRNA synthetase
VLAGFAASNGEARRSIQGGAVRVNDLPVTNERLVLTRDDLNPDGVIKLSLGKKRHVLIRPLGG